MSSTHRRTDDEFEPGTAPDPSDRNSTFTSAPPPDPAHDGTRLRRLCAGVEPAVNDLLESREGLVAGSTGAGGPERYEIVEILLGVALPHPFVITWVGGSPLRITLAGTIDAVDEVPDTICCSVDAAGDSRELACGGGVDEYPRVGTTTVGGQG